MSTNTKLDDALALLALATVDPTKLQAVISAYEEDVRSFARFGPLAGPLGPGEPFEALLSRALTAAESMYSPRAGESCDPNVVHANPRANPFNPIADGLPSYRRAKAMLAIVERLSAPAPAAPPLAVPGVAAITRTDGAP